MIDAYVCPMPDNTCPYCKFELGVGYYCSLENPLEDCDDFWYYTNEGEDAEFVKPT